MFEAEEHLDLREEQIKDTYETLVSSIKKISNTKKIKKKYGYNWTMSSKLWFHPNVPQHLRCQIVATVSSNQYDCAWYNWMSWCMRGPLFCSRLSLMTRLPKPPQQETINVCYNAQIAPGDNYMQMPCLALERLSVAYPHACKIHNSYRSIWFNEYWYE